MKILRRLSFLIPNPGAVSGLPIFSGQSHKLGTSMIYAAAVFFSFETGICGG